MPARVSMKTPCALVTLALLVLAVGAAMAWDQPNRHPAKVRSLDGGLSNPFVGGIGAIGGRGDIERGDWLAAAGQARRTILCPSSDYAMALGVRPFFSNLGGSVKAVSRGGEGTWLSLPGHLRLPTEATSWELYAHLRTWDKVMWRIEYRPWNWSGPGHIPADGDFAGLLLLANDGINTDLAITTFLVGADYDVSFSRELVFGPNVDLHVIKWTQRVAKDAGAVLDFSQTMLQPAIGAHLRYEPTNTGYFSWFKPYLEGRFSWMSLGSLGVSTWDAGLGVAPPFSRNMDAGVKAGYKQWKLDGSRGRLSADVDVEGFFLDFSLRF